MKPLLLLALVFVTFAACSKDADEYATLAEIIDRAADIQSYAELDEWQMDCRTAVLRAEEAFGVRHNLFSYDSFCLIEMLLVNKVHAEFHPMMRSLILANEPSSYRLKNVARDIVATPTPVPPAPTGSGRSLSEEEFLKKYNITPNPSD